MNISTYLNITDSIPDIQLSLMSKEEYNWIKSLTNPFNNVLITDDGQFELFYMINYSHIEFKPLHSEPQIYLQYTHIGESENIYNTRNRHYPQASLGDYHSSYYVNQPMYKPTGVICTKEHMIMHLKDGKLHNSSGNPALIAFSNSLIPLNDYYLHGQRMEKAEYFTYLEDLYRKNINLYPDYDPMSYTKFMAETLGGKL